MPERPQITFCRGSPFVANRGEPYVATAMRELGYRVAIVGDVPLNVKRDEVVFVLNNFAWYPRVRQHLLATPPALRPLVMLWHTEPLPMPSAAPFDRPGLNLREMAKIVLRDMRATDIFTNYSHLRKLAQSGIPDVLMVSTPSRQEFLAEKGITSHCVPFGYDPGYGRDLQLTRDIDVLFLGTPDDPRHRRAVRSLKRKGANVIAKGSWRDPSCWGDERTKLINRTKIFLGLQRRPGELSGVRMLLGMANKALVIAEPIYHPGPYVPGKHYVEATLESMPEVVDHYLRDDKERARITDEAYRFATEELTMDRSVARMAELMEQHLAARLGIDAHAMSQQ